MKASQLPKCLRPFAHLIEEVSDERRGDNDDGYWVYPIKGIWNPAFETHCIHESTPEKCVEQLKGLEKCPLDNCCHD